MSLRIFLDLSVLNDLLGMFDTLCSVELDARQIPLTKEPDCYVVPFAVVLRFGLTELEAHVAWTDQVRALKTGFEYC